MAASLRPLLGLLALVIAVAVLRPDPPSAAGGTALTPFAEPTPASRGASFEFAGVAPGDQQAILTAVDHAQPEARRLIGAVAGLVTIRVGSAGPGKAGTTQPRAGGYDLELDLASVSRGLGPRGIDRLVLHELGHVVDFALVPPALNTRLDAEVPAGYGCEQGVIGSCAPAEERFAETFAKWAMDDIGINLEIGYKVPPPSVPLATWGAPLAALAR